jgi:type IV pilus assembly protein PilC
MKLDEFAFFNQQLAAMLRNGIPLESALGQLCASMRRGDLRDELEKLRTDLANGTPFQQALAARKLPAFYIQMLQVGVKSNDLPGILTLVADYYQSANLIWTRLKGLMVYPAIVLGACLVLSGGLTFFFYRFGRELFSELLDGRQLPPNAIVAVWMPFLLLLLLTVIFVTLLAVRRSRVALQWRLPGFREANLSRVASAMAVMLRGGCSLPEALGLVEQMETGSAAATEVAAWRQWLATGGGRLPAPATANRVFPPLFLWLVASAGEEVATGFQRAAEIYRARASHQIEMMLYAALPVAVVLLGSLILIEVRGAVLPLVRMISMLSGM